MSVLAEIVAGLQNGEGRAVHAGAGMIYCGTRFCENHKCTCGGCGGSCGPTCGCACPACEELLCDLVAGARCRCARGHVLTGTTLEYTRVQGFGRAAEAQCAGCKRPMRDGRQFVGVCYVCKSVTCVQCMVGANENGFKEAAKETQTTRRKAVCIRLQDDADMAGDDGISAFVVQNGDSTVRVGSAGEGDFAFVCTREGCTAEKPCGRCSGAMYSFSKAAEVRCTEKHSLVLVDVARLRCKEEYMEGFWCDGCGAEVARPDAVVLHCNSCKFDLCFGCALRKTDRWENLARDILTQRPSVAREVQKPTDLLDRSGANLDILMGSDEF